MNKQIYITKNDYESLMKLLKEKRPHDIYDETLLGELKKGKIVDSKEIPGDVITMNSKVNFTDIESGLNFTYWLVLPQDSNPDENKISVLSPIGAALLGYRCGDVISLEVPTGQKKLKVEKIIYQPEAEGDYNL